MRICHTITFIDLFVVVVLFTRKFLRMLHVHVVLNAILAVDAVPSIRAEKALVSSMGAEATSGIAHNSMSLSDVRKAQNHCER